MMSDELVRDACIANGMDPDEYLAKVHAARAYQERYCSEFHICCPRCNSHRHTSTYVCYIIDIENPTAFKDENRVRCQDCRWQGTTHQLIPMLVVEAELAVPQE